MRDGCETSPEELVAEGVVLDSLIHTQMCRQRLLKPIFSHRFS